MKNGTLIIFKKEMARFFGDKRLLLTTVILPGLLIFVMYSLMGNAMTSMLNEGTESAYKIAVSGLPDNLKSAFPEDKFSFYELPDGNSEQWKDLISERTLDLCVIFPEDFTNALTEYDPNDSNREIPNVEIYYNSTVMSSLNAYNAFTNSLDSVEQSISNVFNVNYVADENDLSKYDFATDAETTGTMFASVVPMILMILLYTGCVSLAPESIAGEKERGTIATLLITPVQRNEIALGKVLALSCMALLSGLSSFLGTFLSMPSLMGDLETDISAEYYVFTDYLWLILIILSTVLLYVVLISILSTLAKSVKEASTLVMPLMLIVMLASFASMFSTTAKPEIYWYFIPVYNSVQSMVGIFSFSATPINLIVAIVTNVIYSMIGVFVLTKLFNNENVMFGK